MLLETKSTLEAHGTTEPVNEKKTQRMAEGWDSDHLRPVSLRKLLILRSGRTDKTGANSELRYTAGTRCGEIQLDR